MKCNRIGSKCFALIAMAACLSLCISDTATAFNGGSWGGSRGGSWGGSSGGSWGGSSGGSWGSRGAGPVRTFLGNAPVRNLLGRVAYRVSNVGTRFGSSGGSSGGWGSSGGYGSTGYRSYASSGGYSYASYSSHGSTGTSYVNNCYISGSTVIPMDSMAPGYPGTIVAPAGDTAPTEITPVPSGNGVQDPGGNQAPTPAPANTEQTSIQRGGQAVLTVNVPSDAKIFINNHPTRTPGSSRTYVSRQLEQGRVYDYEVRAVLNRDGKQLVRVQNVKLASGVNQKVDFEFSEPLKTTLAVQVPSDAKVMLCGNETTTTGSLRQFSTKTLKPGESWSDYKVVVQLTRNGQTVTREKTVDIPAGETVLVRFDFPENQFVSR